MRIRLTSAGKNSRCGLLTAYDKGVTYVWQMYKGKLPDNDSDWVQIGITTQTSFEINNLDIATKYYFRVAAVTPDGLQDFCAPVMKVVQ